MNAMRAFEAAARNVSFVAAADELSVTPGAISQHVKTLESWAGTPLFRRNAQGIELTQAGASLVAEFTLAFDKIADATRLLRNIKPNADFHIAALPSVAQLWLPKRLSKIRARFPEINFSVTAMETPPRLSRELFDLAVFFGRSDGSRNRVTICADEITPVCAPDLLQRHATLDDMTRLHDQTWSEDWALWSRATGIHITEPQRGPKYSLYSLAVEEAKAGAGVLMGHLCLLEDALEGGSLVAIDAGVSSTGQDLVVHTPEVSQQRPETAEVVSLLK